MDIGLMMMLFVCFTLLLLVHKDQDTTISLLRRKISELESDIVLYKQKIDSLLKNKDAN